MLLQYSCKTFSAELITYASHCLAAFTGWTAVIFNVIIVFLLSSPIIAVEISRFAVLELDDGSRQDLRVIKIESQIEFLF